MFPTEDVVRPILASHEPRIAGIFERAWARVLANPDLASFELKRTRAVIMHQFVMLELRREYAGARDVHLIEEHETIRMLVDRRIAIRLKKMDERGYTRAAPTQAALAFITPSAPLPFAGPDDFPDQCAVDCGYVLNRLGTRIEHVLVAARDGDAVLWSYRIEGAVPGTLAILPPPVAPPSSPASIITVPTTGVSRKKIED